LNEVGAVQGVAGYSAPRFWMRDTGVIAGSLRVHLEPWFVQALATGGRKDSRPGSTACEKVWSMFLRPRYTGSSGAKNPHIGGGLSEVNGARR
jgi:hypothetical protein